MTNTHDMLRRQLGIGIWFRYQNNEREGSMKHLSILEQVLVGNDSQVPGLSRRSLLAGASALGAAMACAAPASGSALFPMSTA
jgi:hypothetical protein